MISFDFIEYGKYFRGEIPSDLHELAYTPRMNGSANQLNQMLNFPSASKLYGVTKQVSVAFLAISPSEYVFAHVQARRENELNEKISLARPFQQVRYTVLSQQSLATLFGIGNAVFESILKSGSSRPDYLLNDYDRKMGKQDLSHYDESIGTDIYSFYEKHKKEIEIIADAVVRSEIGTRYVVVRMPGSTLLERLFLAQEVERVLIRKTGPVSFALDYISHPYHPVRLQFLGNVEEKPAYRVRPIDVELVLSNIQDMYVKECVNYYGDFSSSLANWIGANKLFYGPIGKTIVDQSPDPRDAFARLKSLLLNSYEYVKYCLQNRYPEIMQDEIEKDKIIRAYEKLETEDHKRLVKECGVQKVYLFLFEIYPKVDIVQKLVQEDRVTSEHLLVLFQKARGFSKDEIRSVKDKIRKSMLGSHVQKLFKVVDDTLPSTLQSYFQKGSDKNKGLLARLVDQDLTFDLLVAMATADASVANWFVRGELSYVNLDVVEVDDILQSRVFSLFEEADGLETLKKISLSELGDSDTLLKCKVVSSLKNKSKFKEDEIEFFLESLSRGNSFVKRVLPELLFRKLVDSDSFSLFKKWLQKALNTDTLRDYSLKEQNILYNSLSEHNDKRHKISLDDILVIVDAIKEITSDDDKVVQVVLKDWAEQVLRLVDQGVPFAEWVRGIDVVASQRDNVFLALVGAQVNP